MGKADRDAVRYEGGAHAPDYNKDYEVQRILREQRLNSKRNGAQAAAAKNAAEAAKRPPLPNVHLKKDPHFHRVARMDREKAKVQARDDKILEWKNDLVAYEKARGRSNFIDKEPPSQRNVGSGKITEETFKIDQFKHQIMVARKAAKAAKENNTGGSAACLLGFHERSEVAGGA